MTNFICSRSPPGQCSDVLPGFLYCQSERACRWNETTTRNSLLCPKRVCWICCADANFLLATESEMCYNIPMKTSTATVPTEKPGSTTCRAVTTIPPLVVSSMRIPMHLRVRASWGTICLRIVGIPQSAKLIVQELSRLGLSTIWKMSLLLRKCPAYQIKGELFILIDQEVNYEHKEAIISLYSHVSAQRLCIPNSGHAKRSNGNCN